MIIFQEKEYTITVSDKKPALIAKSETWTLEYVFRLLKNNSFVCKYSIGLGHADKIENYYQSAIDTLKQRMI